MGKLLTEEEFLERVFEKNEHVRNGEIEILGRYNGKLKPIECVCHTHDYNYYTTPVILYTGSGCKLCGHENGAKKQTKSHTQFVKEIREKNEYFANGTIELLGVYTKQSEPIPAHCNAHNYDWNAYPTTLYDGKGCPLCGRNDSSRKQMMPHDEFVKKVMDTNHYVANGDIDILGQYSGANQPIKCRCNIHNYTWSPHASSLYKDAGCKYCGRESGSKNKNKTHEKFVEDVQKVDDNIVIVGTYINARTKVEVMYPCGHTYLAFPSVIMRGETLCPYCSNRSVLVGYNDLATVRPDIISLLKDKSDGHKYVAGSAKEVIFICPNCQKEIKKRIVDVCERGLCCQHCSDGVSYPNKFGRALLDQLLGQNYECEYQPDWAQPYFYDNYFEYQGKKYILEMDGAFHYVEITASSKSLQERQAVDAIKNLLANQNGVDVIRIDCLYSDSNYIKNNILKSKLSDIFDLSNINWLLCDKMAQSSLVKRACDMYMNETSNIKEIGLRLHLSVVTVRNYLHRGTKLGWCNYDSKYSRGEGARNRAKSVLLIDSNGNIINRFENPAMCVDEINRCCNAGVTYGGVCWSCRTLKPHKGFEFRYENLTIQN